MAEEPLIIETKGRWVNFEEITQNTFEVGKTYHIKVGGVCQFMISKNKPTGCGLGTNEITFEKDDNRLLWIKTR